VRVRLVERLEAGIPRPVVAHAKSVPNSGSQFTIANDRQQTHREEKKGASPGPNADLTERLESAEKQDNMQNLLMLHLRLKVRCDFHY
jgi:hypothetical protein